MLQFVLFICHLECNHKVVDEDVELEEIAGDVIMSNEYDEEGDVSVQSVTLLQRSDRVSGMLICQVIKAAE